jgi:hypothetical protein
MLKTNFFRGAQTGTIHTPNNSTTIIFRKSNNSGCQQLFFLWYTAMLVVCKHMRPVCFDNSETSSWMFLKSAEEYGLNRVLKRMSCLASLYGKWTLLNSIVRAILFCKASIVSIGRILDCRCCMVNAWVANSDLVEFWIVSFTWLVNSLVQKGCVFFIASFVWSMLCANDWAPVLHFFFGSFLRSPTSTSMA